MYRFNYCKDAFNSGPKEGRNIRRHKPKPDRLSDWIKRAIHSIPGPSYNTSLAKHNVKPNISTNRHLQATYRRLGDRQATGRRLGGHWPPRRLWASLETRSSHIGATKEQKPIQGQKTDPQAQNDPHQAGGL